MGYCVFGLCAHSHGQVRLTPDSCLKSAVVWAKTQVGVREKTGRNDGLRVDFYNQTAKVPLRSPYCASFVWTAFVLVGCKPEGIKYPAQARQWFLNKSQVVLTQRSLRGNRRMLKTPKAGCVVGYYFQKPFNRISHIEILEKIDFEDEYIYCVGANTSARSSATSVDRAGDGVYYVRRRLNTFHVISDVMTPVNAK